MTCSENLNDKATELFDMTYFGGRSLAGSKTVLPTGFASNGEPVLFGLSCTTMEDYTGLSKCIGSISCISLRILKSGMWSSVVP